MSGGRLAAIMGITAQEYLKRFDRMNLLFKFPGRWPVHSNDKFPREAALYAAEAMRPLLGFRRVVFVGRPVAIAFGYGELEFYEGVVDARHGFHAVAVPHPSGRNFWYHRPGNKEKAREFWSRFFKDSQDLSFAPASSIMARRALLDGHEENAT